MKSPPTPRRRRRDEKPKTEPKTFPAGSYIIRMDQPYSRIADALLDYQYWSPTDPQKRPYDDTGWTFGELFNVQVVRVTDAKVLDAAMERSTTITVPTDIKGTGAVFIVNNDADPSLLAFRYRLKGAAFDVAEEPFEAAGRKFNRGSFIIRNAQAADVQAAGRELSLQAHGVDAAPSVKTHPVKAPRIGYIHTWLGTQDEGWWRMEFDRLKIPYDYISTQVVAKEASLISKWDVLVFPPVGRGAQQIVAGMPMWRNPLPWKTTPLTPNIGKIDSTDDMRPGLGWSGLVHLEQFVRQGGVLIVVRGHVDLRQHVRDDAGPVRADADASQRSRHGHAREDRRRREPDRLRVRRERVDLLGAWPGPGRQQHSRRPGRRSRRRCGAEPADRPRHR